MLLAPSHKINYSPPDNFVESDRALFYDENFSNTISTIEMAEIKNVFISNKFLFQGTRLLYEFTCHNNVSTKTYLKSLLKKYIRPTQNIDSAILGIQDWDLNYFHWMTEVLPALIAMNAHLKNIPVLLNSNSAKTKHIINSLNLLQIPFVLHDIFNKTGRVLNLYAVKVPRVAEFNESLIQTTRAAFYKKLNLDEIKIPFRKLHVSRGKAKRRKIINENKLIDILQHNGFQTVFLEDYSLEEQIILLSEAKVIISAHGAGLTNIIFMNKETTVIELKAYNNDYWCFYSLARLSGLKYKYLLCESDHYNHRNANIRVDISKITELIHKV